MMENMIGFTSELTIPLPPGERDRRDDEIRQAVCRIVCRIDPNFSFDGFYVSPTIRSDSTGSLDRPPCLTFDPGGALAMAFADEHGEPQADDIHPIREVIHLRRRGFVIVDTDTVVFVLREDEYFAQPLIKEKWYQDEYRVMRLAIGTGWGWTRRDLVHYLETTHDEARKIIAEWTRRELIREVRPGRYGFTKQQR